MAYEQDSFYFHYGLFLPAKDTIFGRNVARVVIFADGLHYIGTMKQTLLTIAAAALLFAACDPLALEEEPTAAEKLMVTTEMTWTLDSVLVIYNYQLPGEARQMLYPEDGIDIWSYTMYPCTYNFPNDLYFTDEFSGKKVYLSKEFGKGYCKYICTYKNNIISGGYLCYYKDYFTFQGVSQGGWAEFMIREADTNWNVDVWTCTYNAQEDYETGDVLERCVEYYSREK